MTTTTALRDPTFFAIYPDHESAENAVTLKGDAEQVQKAKSILKNGCSENSEICEEVMAS